MRYLVTGATGAVGPVLVQRLLDTGGTVRVLSRRADRLAWDGAVEVRRGDLLDEAAVADAMRNVDVVFHLAALLHQTRPEVAGRAAYTRVNVEGTQRVLDAAKTAGVSRLVMFSTISVYGASDRIFHEEDDPAPDSWYAESKLEAERLALAAVTRDGDRFATVLRLAAVYGPRMKGNYSRLVQALAKHRFVPLGTGTNRRTIVFDRDVADAALASAAAPAAIGRIYNVTGGIHQMREILSAICMALGRGHPILHAPVTPVRLCARISEFIAGALGRSSPLQTATIDKYVEDVAVSGERIATEVGWRPQVELLDGWRETVTGMRTLGVLR